MKSTFRNIFDMSTNISFIFQFDTARQLEWLKTVKQSHGSVEVTSLAQAESINTNGIYQVGNLQKTVIIKNPVSRDDLIFGVLMPLSAVFQLYHGDQF